MLSNFHILQSTIRCRDDRRPWTPLSDALRARSAQTRLLVRDPCVCLLIVPSLPLFSGSSSQALTRRRLGFQALRRGSTRCYCPPRPRSLTLSSLLSRSIAAATSFSFAPPIFSSHSAWRLARSSVLALLSFAAPSLGCSLPSLSLPAARHSSLSRERRSLVPSLSHDVYT